MNNEQALKEFELWLLQEKQLEAINKLYEPTNDKRLQWFSKEYVQGYLANNSVLKLNEILYIGQLDDADICIIEQLKESIRNNQCLAVDFETSSNNPLTTTIKGCSISNGKHHYYFDCFNDSVYNELGNILSMLTNYQGELIAHNSKFEYLVTLNNYGIRLSTLKCTMVAAYLLLNRVKGISLKDLSIEFLNRYPNSWLDLIPNQYRKGKAIDSEKLMSEGYSASGIELINKTTLATYCCEDSFETWLLWQKFKPMLQEQNLWNLYLEGDSANQLSTAEIERVGCKWSRDENLKLSDALELKGKELLKQLQCWLPEFQNIDKILSSPTQLQELLFAHLRYNTKNIKKTKTGHSVDQETLNKLIELYPNHEAKELLEKIILFKKINTLNNTFVKGVVKFANDKDIIHCNINTCFTTTGRFSISNPNLSNQPNPSKAESENIILQEIIRDIRKQYLPRDGYILGSSDYNSFELRILAYLSNSKFLIKCFDEGLSPHTLITEYVLDTKYNKNNPYHVSCRTVFKTAFVFGIVYGATAQKAFTLCQKYNLTYTLFDCIRIREQVLKLMGLDEYIALSQLKTINKGYTETVMGRRRYFAFNNPLLSSYKDKEIEYSVEHYNWLMSKVTLDAKDEASLREALNAPIQGSNADALRIACNKLVFELMLTSDGEFNVLNLVHDEVVFEFIDNEDNRSYYVDAVKSIMEEAINLNNIEVIAEPKLGNNWSECK